MNILVTYFSCTNTTKKVALKIATATKGDLFEIQPQTPYTSDDLNWTNPQSRSSIEMKDLSSRPAIIKNIDIANYDVIFVGFPIWWYVAPTIINTFLESYDFSSKLIIPFATSGGSGAGQTDQYLHASCSDLTHWYPTKVFNTSIHDQMIEDWLKNINY